MLTQTRSRHDGKPTYTRLIDSSSDDLQGHHLTSPHVRAASLSPQPRRRRRSSDELTIKTSSGHTLPSNQAVFSPSGPTAGRHIDTTRSMRRYSLFGPNVAPFWEYYTGIPGKFSTSVVRDQHNV